jgi:hypothetical protein
MDENASFPTTLRIVIIFYWMSRFPFFHLFVMLGVLDLQAMDDECETLFRLDENSPTYS